MGGEVVENMLIRVVREGFPKEVVFQLDLNKVRDWAIETSGERKYQEERKAINTWKIFSFYKGSFGDSDNLKDKI